MRPYSSPKSMGKRASGFIGYAKWRALCRHPRLRDATCTTSPIMSLSMIGVHHGAEVDDLNITLIKGYLREVGSSLYAEADTMDFVELCQRMDIVQGPKEYLKPKTSGSCSSRRSRNAFSPMRASISLNCPKGREAVDLRSIFLQAPFTIRCKMPCAT